MYIYRNRALGHISTSRRKELEISGNKSDVKVRKERVNEKEYRLLHQCAVLLLRLRAMVLELGQVL
jgi:hypothetical protein